MKLKEKLAHESVENCGEYSNACYKWYLKGFEKAREMAKASLEKYTEEPIGNNSRHYSGYDIDLELEGLGEEEVKE